MAGDPPPPPDSADSLAAALLAKRDVDQDLAEDDQELARQDRAAAVAAGLAAPPLPGEDQPAVDFVPPPPGAAAWAEANLGMLLQPNFLALYVGLGAMGLLLVRKKRHTRR
jgi:hypothetical protein